MKTKLLFIAVIVSTKLFGQMDTSFFPTFTPYSTQPIFETHFGFSGAVWNDPHVMKDNGQFVMYASAVKSINHPDDSISIYRLVSADGYNWTLNPTSPVLKPEAGTYYGLAVETPTVVKTTSGIYHMYCTIYLADVLDSFKISHATSSDGINWVMDPVPFFEKDTTKQWMGNSASNPGATIKDDTIYVFFSAVDKVTYETSIGLVRTVDGSTVIDTQQVLTLPQAVYPYNQNYVGLSIAAPTMIGDTMYLFTTVDQYNLDFQNVAIHQFKSYGSMQKWYYDDTPILEYTDFSWTNGNYKSGIWGPTVVHDGNKLFMYFAGFHLGDIDTSTNDTTFYMHFVGNELYPDTGYWGIGLAEYAFNSTTGIKGNVSVNEVNIYPNPTKASINISSGENIQYIKIKNLLGQELKTFTNTEKNQIISLEDLPTGMYFIEIKNQNNQTITRKIIRE